MKLNSLTVGRRVVLGFALLLAILFAVGAITLHLEDDVGEGLNFVNRQVAPASRHAADLLAHMDEFRLNARVYGLTGSDADLQLTRAALEKVKTSQTHISEMMAADSRLAAQLGEAARDFDASLAAYEPILRRTATHQEMLSSLWESVEESRIQTEDACAVMLDGMFAASARDHANNNAPEAARRLDRMQGMVTLGGMLREFHAASLRGRAERDPAAILEGLKRLPTALSLVEDIRLTQVNADNRARLDAVEAALRELQVGGQAYAAELTALAETNTARARAGEVAAATTLAFMDAAEKTTQDYMVVVESALNVLRRTVQTGSLAGLLFGLGVAWLIIRQINRALTATAEGLTDGSRQVASAAGQVSASSQSLAEGSSEQAASLEEISSSIEELSSMTKRNADNAQAGKTASNQARVAAETGAAEMTRMQEAMNAIQQSSADISKIIKTIDEIAFQTNILALNAAVEAARAGEAGAGFAVVADEVRSLAQRSAVAARETADKIAAATQKSAQGVELSTRVGGGLREIVEKAREVDRLVAEVATASHQQSEGLAQINVAITQMDKVTQSNAAGAEETASAAEELNAQSSELQQAAARLAALVGARIESHVELAAAATVGGRPMKVARSAAGTGGRPAGAPLPTVSTRALHAPATPADGKAESLSFHD